MTMNIPGRRLIITTVLTAIIFTGLIGFLLIVSIGSVPNVPRILADTFVSIVLAGLIHVFALKFARRKHPGWSHLKTSMFRYTVTFILTFIYTLLVELMIGFTLEPAKLERVQTRIGIAEQLLGAAIITVLILVTHNQVLMRQRRIDAELELSETRAANIEATNLLLQQQIQPHFLFNALNIMNSLYKRDYSTGHTYMLHLANFLRASIASTKQNLLTVADEIKTCNDYVAMQKIRFNHALNFSISVDPEKLQAGYVPSFSLQPLIENAIKHNELTIENPLQIEIYSADEFLYVKNNLSAAKAPVASTGQGLANLAKRYQLLSGDEVDITKDNYHFIVRLKILSNEYHNN